MRSEESKLNPSLESEVPVVKGWILFLKYPDLGNTLSKTNLQS